jgi:anti-sigma-K factor RskA
MNLVELQRKLMGAARANPPGDAVPYAFEKRITARLKEMKVVDPLQVWGRGLWRAAVFCVAVAALLTAYSMLAPSNNPEPISQQVEQTLFAATESNGSDLTGELSW